MVLIRRSHDLHGETGHFKKVRITALSGRENLQTNLRNTAERKRSCNSVEKHELVLQTIGTLGKASISESTEHKSLHVFGGN